jgi:hypothetical protein
MFAGHLGAGLAIGSAERRVNVGIFVAAALLLDIVLWLLVLAGCESVAIPPGFARTHQAEFVFPYSHSLAAGAAWSALAAVAAWAVFARLGAARIRLALLMAAAVFSHWVLDALVHRPEMPLAGSASPMLGLGLWDRLPVALALEGAIVVAGLFIFVRHGGLPRGRSIAIVVLTLLVFAFTALGMTLAPPPPSGFAMAGSSLATLAAVCALMVWLSRPPSVHPGG